MCYHGGLNMGKKIVHQKIFENMKVKFKQNLKNWKLNLILKFIYIITGLLTSISFVCPTYSFTLLP